MGTGGLSRWGKFTNVFFSFVLVISFIPSAAFAAPSSQGGDVQDSAAVQSDDGATADDGAAGSGEGQQAADGSAEALQAASLQADEAEASLSADAAGADAASDGEAAPQEEPADDRPFSGGAGTQDDPYLISTADDMVELANTTNSSSEQQAYKDTYFKMTADIDLKPVCYEVDGSAANDVSWTPIGTQVYNSSSYRGAFGGHFDGGYHCVKNLYYNGSSQYAGLFGFVKNGSIENLTVEGRVSNPTNNNGNTGAVVGWIESTSEQTASRISNVSSKAEVVGLSTVGGVVGRASNPAIIEGCANHGTVTVNSWGMGGGIVGRMQRQYTNLTDDLVVRNCYNDGSLSVINRQASVQTAIGGIAASASCYQNKDYFQQIYNCYDAGAYASDLTSWGGGVIGLNVGASFNQAYGNYYLEGNPATTDSVQANVNAKKMTSEQMKAPAFASMMGGAFGHVEGSYPALLWEGISGAPEITSQPVGADYELGADPANLAVEAQAPAEGTGAGGELSYQWYGCASESYFDATPIEGKTSATLDLGAGEAGETWYFCEVTNAFAGGSSKACSNMVRVYFAESIAQAPQVSGPEEGQSVSYGDEVSPLTVTVKNPDDLADVTYQWYRSASGDGAGAAAIDGADKASYTPSNSEVGSWYYYCTVTNTFQGTSVATASTDPVQVSVSSTVTVRTAEQLAKVATNVAAGTQYKDITVTLADDIDLAAVCGGDLGDWAPIGTKAYPFLGSFEGGYHKISNLSIEEAAADYQGLFGYVGANLSGSSRRIGDFTITGTVKTSGSYAGAVAGLFYGGTGDSKAFRIENVRSEVEVSGKNYVGGIAGQVNYAQVSGCANAGKVTGTGSLAGGIAGSCDWRVVVTDCYNLGAVSGSNYTGGIAGRIAGSDQADTASSRYAVNCYNAGKVTGSSSKPIADTSKATQDCYYLEGTGDNGDKATAVSDEWLKSLDAVAALGGSYSPSASGGYPQLAWETAAKGAPVIGSQPASGEANVGDASPAKMEVSASVWEGFDFSDGKISYQWWSSDDPAIGDDDKMVEGASDREFAPSTEAASALWYYCVVTNAWGEGDGAQSASTASAIASYPVHSGKAAATPTFTTQPKGGSYGALDDPSPLTAEAEVSGDGAGTITYQWYRNNIESEMGATPVEGATDPSCTPAMAAGDAYYYCVATNTFEITKTATARSDFAKVHVDADVVVSKAEDMWKVAEKANDATSPASFEGSTVYLAADVDLGASAERPWVSIKGFKGTFEGGGHAIEGMYSKTGGLFDDLSAPAVVRGFTISGTVDAEAVYDAASGAYATEAYVGAVANTLSNGAAVENVGNECDVTATYAAGIVGKTVGAGNRISGCCNSGKVVSTNIKRTIAADGSVTTDNYNASNAYGAGIVVRGATRDAKASVESCYNAGEVSTTSTVRYVRLFGISYIYADSADCYNSGSIDAVATSTTSGPTQLYDAANGYVSNVYYLDSTATAKNQGTPKTEDDLKSEAMPGLLGSAFAYSQGSYPVLAWQLASGTPTITAQPQGAAYTQPVSAAEPLKVEAQKPSAHAVGGTGELSYRWQFSADGKKWTDIENATDASYTPSVGEAGSTHYRCVVTNTYAGADGEVKAAAASDAAVVVVLEADAAKPEFTTQPKGASYGWGDEAAALAAEASFADGETAPKGDIAYQWYSSTSGPDEGGAAIEGATEKTYTPPTAEAIGDVWYWCVATSSISGLPVAEAASDAAKVTVRPSVEIATAEGLVEFLQSTVQNSTVYTDYTGKIVALTSDIDLADIGGRTPNVSMLFKGTFDGQGHTIGGLEGGSLISAIVNGSNAVFRNLTLDIDVEVAPAADAQGQGTSAALVGEKSGTVAFEDVTVTGSMSATFATNTVYTYARYGSFVEKSNGATTFTRCANEVDVEVSRPDASHSTGSAYAYVGGFVGYVDSGVSYRECVNRGDISVSGTWNICTVGGFTGYDSSSQSYTDCLNEGDVTVGRGGASGMSGQGSPKFTGCVNTGSVLCVQAPAASYPLARGMQSSSKGNLYLDSSIPEEARESAYGAAAADAELNSQATADSLGAAWKFAGGKLMLAWDDGGGRPAVSSSSPDAEYLQGDDAAQLSVAAELPAEGLAGHDGELSYQWYRNTTGKARPSADVPVADATGTACTPDTSLPSDYYYYYCAVTNTFDGGRTAVACSEPVQVHIVTELAAATPYFTVQPVTTCYVKGDAAGAVPFEVEVATTGYDDGQAVGELSYQWYAAKTIESYQRAEGTAIKGATSAAYTPYVGKTGTVYYYCVATNTLEGGTRAGKVASAKSTVVKARTWSEADATPVIESQPADAQYTQGDEAAALTVEAHKPQGVSDMLGGADDAGSALHYQWYLMTGDSPEPAADTAVGADSASYTPPTTVDPDYYGYYCVVTNQISISNPRGAAASSVTTEPARITVVSTTDAVGPTVVSNMQDGSYAQGETGATLSVEVTNPDAVGMGELSYQWYRTQNEMCDPGADEAIAGATDASYTVDTAIHRGGWKIYCVATNTFENVKVESTASEAAEIEIRGHEISTAQELADLAAYVNVGGDTVGREYVLTTDIDLSEVCGADLGNWAPIGDQTHPFKGTFDGQGHSIDNLYYSGSGSYVGLFGYLRASCIENFTVSGSVVSSSGTTGGVLGAAASYDRDLTVRNVGSYVDIAYTGSNACRIGGIAGDLTGSTYSITVERCFNKGRITNSSTNSSSYVGGVVGDAYSDCTIADSYNAGEISSLTCGGVLGGPFSSLNLQVSGCFNWGQLTGTGNIGGIATKDPGTSKVYSNCHYLDSSAAAPIAGMSEVAGITAETRAMMTSDGFATAMGESFKPGDEHPILAWEPAPGQPSISVQPQGGQYVLLNEDAPELWVMASLPAGDKAPAKGELHYQWYKSATGQIEVERDEKVGDDSEEYVPATDALGTAYYYCVVTDQYQGGSSNVTSKVADFTVMSGTPAAKPVIDVQPASGAAYAQGQAAEPLSVEAGVSGEGAGELSYQWFGGYAADGSDAVAVSGAVETGFTPSTAEVGTRYYFCRVTNTFETYMTASADSSISEVRVSGKTISSADDLVYIQRMVNDNGISFEGVGFELACDIDLSSVCGPDLGSWEPIGTSNAPFKGSIEGNGHTVSGLYIHKEAAGSSGQSNYWGLFGLTNGAAISNLHVDGSVYAQNGNYVGLLAGYTTATTLRNIECSGSVAGYSYVGGVAGYLNTGSSMLGCKNTADVVFDGYSYKSWGNTQWRTGNNAGGVAGYANGAAISDCYNTGTVSGGSHSGTTCAGIVATGNNSSVSNCLNMGGVPKGYPVAVTVMKAENCYYLAGCSTGADSTGSDEKNADEMAEADMAEALGSAYKAGTAHPILAWEADPAAPVIEAQPADAWACVGDDAPAVSVKASLPETGAGTSGTLSYQWHDASDGAAIDGATDAAWSPDPSQIAQHSVYCVVTNSYGEGLSASVATNTVSCNVVSKTGAAVPEIVEQPQDAYMDKGGDAVPVTVEAKVEGLGAGELSYQWYAAAGDSPDPVSDSKIAGATGSSYEPSTLSPMSQNVYCVVTNTLDGSKTASAASNVATVTVAADWMIYTAEDFIAFRDAVNDSSSGYYNGLSTTAFLMDDIDLSAYCPEGSAFTPFTQFYGTFDGLGHTVTGFHSTHTDAQEHGMFKAVYGTVRNLVVKGSMDGQRNALIYTLGNNGKVLNVGSEIDYDLAAGNYSGGLVGLASNGSTIDSCYWKGTARTSHADYFGGLVGNANTSTISNCYTEGSMTPISDAQYGSKGYGGVVGGVSADGLTLRNCYTTVKIASTQGKNYVGGIVGRSNANYYDYYGPNQIAESNNYYSEDTAKQDAAEKSTRIALADMQTADFAATMGSAYRANPGGTPALKWEKRVSIADGSVDAVGAQVYTGSAVKPELTVRAADGTELVAGADYTVAYSGNVAAGTATATVTGAGAYTGTLTATFAIERASIAGGELTVAAKADYTGKPVDAGAKVALGGKALVEGTDYAASYVDAEGAVSDTAPTEIGSYKVYAEGVGNYAGSLGPVSLEVAKASIEGATATMTASRAYTGEPVEADLVVTYGGKTLAEGTDYEVAYASETGLALQGAPTEPGAYLVTAKGAGLYEGQLDCGKMEISKASIAGAKATMSAERAYTGKPVEADLVATYDGRLLAEGADYTVSYADADGKAIEGAPTGPGAYTVSIAGAGLYAGVLEVGKMEIGKAAIEGAEATMTASRAYTGEPVEADLSLALDGRLLTPGTDYTVSYASESGLALTGAPTDEGTYLVSAKGAGLYEGTVSAGKMTIAKASIEGAKATLAASDYIWTGQPVKAEAQVVLGSTILAEGADYELSYASESGLALQGAPTDEGTYTVTVKGAGVYAGSVSAGRMTIAKQSIAGAEVSLASVRKAWTGEPQSAGVSVSLDGKALSEGADFNVVYSDASGKALTGLPSEAGVYGVAVEAAGAYTGRVDAGTFEIAALATSFARLAGDNRVATMAAIDGEAFADGTCSDVVLVSAYGFADALSASALAGLYGCPVVTTDGDYLSPEAASEIERMAADGGVAVHIVGGTAVVLDAVAGQAAQLPCVSKVERISGDNRAATAVAVAQAGAGGWSKTAIVVKGGSFADALSISSYAYASRSPLFMSMGGEIDDATAKAIADGGFEKVVVLGGEGGDDGIKDAAVEALGLPFVRLAGDGRVQTSVEVAKWATGRSNASVQPEVVLSYDGMAVANAWNYPDALASVSLLGPARSVLILADGGDDAVAAVAGTVSENRASITAGYVLGGTAAVPQSVEDAANAALKGE